MNYDNGPACLSILQFVKPNHTGVEIGVFKGDSSEYFLKRCEFMYLIDPCIPYNGNPETEYFSDEEQLRNRLVAYSHKFSFLKDFSLSAAIKIPMVDFVFVDGNHEYIFVRKDVETYWPKIKPGGFISGHDYDSTHPGVQRAVDEFFGRLSLEVEHYLHCWLVKKHE